MEKVDTTSLEKELAELKAIMIAATAEQIAKSERDAKRFSEIMADGLEHHIEEFKTLDLTLNNMAHQIAGYSETLSSNLMKVTTRYVITDEPLKSPAGFHPDTQVFVQTTIAIHTDQDPHTIKIPHTEKTLKVYDMKKPK